MSGEDVLLVAVLAAPLVGGVAAVLAPGPKRGRWIQRAACTLAAVGWAVLAARGRLVAGGGFHAGPLLAAAGCGAALLVVSDERPATRRVLLLGSLALTALLAGLAAGTGGESGFGAVAGLALAAGCALAASAARGKADTRVAAAAAAAAAAGVLLSAIGFVLVHDTTGTSTLPTPGAEAASPAAVGAFLAAAAALATAAALRPRSATSVLLAGGLGLGLLVAPLRWPATAMVQPGSTDSLLFAVVALALAAVAAAAGRRAALALALLSLSVAAGPAALLGSSRLLGAAAVLVLALDRRPAWLLGVPGGVALVVSATQSASGVAVGLALAAGVVAALLAFAPDPQTGGARRPGLAALPAVAAAAWLFLAPGSWSWTGAEGLGPYDSGAARAVAIGLITAVVVVVLDQLRTRAGATDALGWAAAGQAGPVPGPPAGPEVAEEGPEIPADTGKGPRRRRRERRRRGRAAREERGLP